MCNENIVFKIYIFGMLFSFVNEDIKICGDLLKRLLLVLLLVYRIQTIKQWNLRPAVLPIFL